MAGTNFDYTTADFDATTEETGAWTFQLPANLSGTTASLSYTWISNNASCANAATDDVCFVVDGDSFANDAAFHTGTLGGTAVGQTDRCLANGDVMLSPSFTFTHSMVAGETAVVTVVRDLDGSLTANCDTDDDDLDVDASLLSLRFCYEVDNLASGE